MKNSQYDVPKYPVPRLVQAMLRKAHRMGMTEERMCLELGIVHSQFSRWKRGIRMVPDPRLAENREFYLKISRFLEISLGEAVATAIFLDEKEIRELDAWIFESIATAKSQLKVPELPEECRTHLQAISINLLAHPRFGQALVGLFKSYVTEVCGQTWYENPVLALEHVRRRETETATGT